MSDDIKKRNIGIKEKVISAPNFKTGDVIGSVNQGAKSLIDYELNKISDYSSATDSGEQVDVSFEKTINHTTSKAADIATSGIQTFDKKIREKNASERIQEALDKSRYNAITISDKRGHLIEVTDSNIDDIMKKIKKGEIDPNKMRIREATSNPRNKKITAGKLRGASDLKTKRMKNAADSKLQKMRGASDNARKTLNQAKKFEKKMWREKKAAEKTEKSIRKTAKNIFRAGANALKTIANALTASPIGVIIGIAALVVIIPSILIVVLSTATMSSSSSVKGTKQKMTAVSEITYSSQQALVYRYLNECGDFDDADIAAILSNVAQESGVRANCVQTGVYGDIHYYPNPKYKDSPFTGAQPPNYISNCKLTISEAEYIAKVESKEISRNEFIYDGVGFGLFQYTDPSIKEKYYDYVVNAIGHVSGELDIDNLNIQLEFFRKDIKERKAGYEDITIYEKLKNASDDERYTDNKARVFCKYYEWSGYSDPPSDYMSAHTKRFTDMKKYVAVMKNPNLFCDFSPLNGMYFYQLDSGPCNACACANVFFRYYYLMRAKNWENFNVQAKDDSGVSVYDNIVITGSDTRRWGSNGIVETHSGWSPRAGGSSHSMTYGGITATFVTVSGSYGNGDDLRQLLIDHPAGVKVYVDRGGGHYHAVTVTKYDENEQQFYIVDPADGMRGEGYTGIERPAPVNGNLGHNQLVYENGGYAGYSIANYGYIE